MKSIKPLQSNSARHSGTTVILIHNCVTFVYAFHMIRLPMNMRSIVDIIWLEQIYQNVYVYYAHSSEFINYYHTICLVAWWWCARYLCMRLGNQLLIITLINCDFTLWELTCSYGDRWAIKQMCISNKDEEGKKTN